MTKKNVAKSEHLTNQSRLFLSVCSRAIRFLVYLERGRQSIYVDMIASMNNDAVFVTTFSTTFRKLQQAVHRNNWMQPNEEILTLHTSTLQLMTCKSD